MTKSVIKLDERERAAFGPRALKKPGSADWCWQTLDGLKHNYERIEERFNDIEHTIAELEQFKAWKTIPPARPYGSLDKLLKAELGITKDKLNTQILVLKARNRAVDAKDQANRSRQGQRTDLVNNKNGSVNEVGRPMGNSNAYAIRKLRADRPDIHARVLAGEITANAGMVEAGFRKKRPSKKLTPLEHVLKWLPKLTRDDIQQLREAIQ